MALSRHSSVGDRRRDKSAEDEIVRLAQDVIDEITWYMREQKVSRTELATRMGVSPGRVSQILSGDGNLTLRTLGTVICALEARFEVALRPVPEPENAFGGSEGMFDSYVERPLESVGRRGRA